ncbi:MAG: RimK family protein [Pontiellaceae bacterium]|nr:RimK family protein [Pontiellaceae bacterium]
MSTPFIVVDRLEDWTPYYPGENLITAEEYLATDPSPTRPLRVINLCRDYKYLGKGYYCSLLAEARGDRVIPSVRTINDLSKRRMYTLGLSLLEKAVKNKKAHLSRGEVAAYEFRVYFGTTATEELQGLARQLFELFPCPILNVAFKQVAKTWVIESVKALSIYQLNETEQDEFAAALDHFSRKVWRRPRRKKRFSYDLAVLVDPQEALPPSNRKALENFVQAGRQIGIDVELIGKRDYPRLTEYDALFIRETTSVDHHTYQFAQKAEFAHMPVIDDPNSILKCANKVYLAELLRENELATPRTEILYRDQPATLERAADRLGFPLVLKIPDGSFSRGVHKAASMEELKARTKELFQSSVLVLAQEFMYTDFDWRIGVLGGQALFACKYYMSAGHWQIYNHSARSSARTGGFETLAVEQAPAAAVKLAVKACGLIGNGLYGVDIKQKGNRFSVIEINDNPNIDAGIEDAHLDKLLYLRVMEHFYSEMERCRYGAR